MPPKKYLNWKPFAHKVLEIRARSAFQALPPTHHCTIGHPARLRESGTHAVAYFCLVSPKNPGPWYVIDSILWDTEKRSKICEATFIVPYRDPPSRRHRFSAEWDAGLRVFVVRPDEEQRSGVKCSRPRGDASAISYDGCADGLEEYLSVCLADEPLLVEDVFDLACLPPLPDDYLEDASEYEIGDDIKENDSPGTLCASEPLTTQALVSNPKSTNEIIPVQNVVAAQSKPANVPEAAEVAVPGVQSLLEATDETSSTALVTAECQPNIDTHTPAPATTDYFEDAPLQFSGSCTTQQETQDYNEDDADDVDDQQTTRSLPIRDLSEIAEGELRWRDFLFSQHTNIHHFNFFGDSIAYPSFTPAEISLFAIMAGPKAWLYEISYRAAVARQAIKLVDPVLYTGPINYLSTLKGHHLIRAITGKVHQFYTEHGWWTQDKTRRAQDRPILDPADSETYDLEPWLPINGWLKVHLRVPTRHEYLAAIVTPKLGRRVRPAVRTPKSPLSSFMLASDC